MSQTEHHRHNARVNGNRAFLNVEHHPQAGNWEEKDRVDRTWENWKLRYLKADKKALLK